MSRNTDKLPPNYQWNFRAFAVDFVCFMMAMTFISSSSVLPAFIRELTDSTVAIGLAGTVFSGGWFLPQLLVARLIGHKPRKKPYLIAAVPARGLFLVIAAALWTGTARYPTAMLAIFFVCLTLFAIGDGFSSVPWYDILARTIPANRRGRLFGVSQVIQGIAGIGIGGVVVFVLGSPRFGFPCNYTLLFLAASVLLVPSSIALLLLREPSPSEAVQHEPGAARDSWRPILREDRRFRRFLLCRILFNAASLATPFYVGFAQDVLTLPSGAIGTFVMAQTLGGVVGSALFGIISDRWGPRHVVRLATAAGAIVPLLALVMHLAQGAWTVQAFPLVYLVLGAANSAFMLGFSNYLLAIAPGQSRPTYIGLSNTILGVMTIVPTLGGWILEASSYIFLFCLAGTLGIGAFAVAVRLRSAHRTTLAPSSHPTDSWAPV